MKKLKLFLLTLLIAVMALSLTGCKNQGPEGTQDPAKKSDPVEIKPLEPIDENILMPEAGVF